MKTISVAVVAACSGILCGASTTPTVQISPGINLPLVSLGTGSGQKGNVTNATTTWIEIGGVGIDTALIYGDQPKVADGIAKAGTTADKVFITTKVPCGSYDSVTKGIDENLQQLKVKTVDLTLIHAFPNPTVACRLRPGASIKETWRAFEDAKAAGKTKAIGVSTFKVRDMEELQKYARELPSVNQDSLSIGHHDDDTIRFCDANNVTYMAYSPLCGGFDGSSCRHGNVMTIPEVQAAAKAHGVSPAQVALKWIVQQGRPLACASWKESYMQEDLDLWSFNLTEDEMNILTALKPGASAVAEVIV